MKEFLERIKNLPPERVKLLAAQLQGRVDALENQRSEPVAIIGMSCRFPGGANSPEAFWQMLHDGVDAMSEIPAERWNIDDYYDPDPEAPGKIATRWGGFLTGIDLFDAPFFGIAPREAAGLDPQQRLFLELSWEALERAGQSPDELMGSDTGVFLGISGSDYLNVHMQNGIEEIDAYFASGVAHSIASGRLSYVLGTHGPSFPVDTACSSSLVAAHLAVQSLRGGECRMALVGGINLILTPETFITLSKAHMLSPDGRCKAFDARADGFARSEGGGVIVLKRLSDALADGDNILALIRGSAVNQDGRSNGLTAPNGPSQEAVIRAALANGKVQPQQISYLETHGTGTSLGDPIEVKALAAVLGANRAEALMLGSVKTNVGHMESAAGIGGLIKTVLMLQHETVPPHLHLQSLNPHIAWQEMPVRIPTQVTPWRTGEVKYAGVSSFGFSGTNAHVVLSSPPPVVEMTPEIERPLHLYSLSARSEAALGQLAQRHADFLAQNRVDAALAAYTANAGRSHFNYRMSVVGSSAEDIQQKITAYGQYGQAAGVFTGMRQGTRQPRVAFLFTGQGAQYAGMARGLYETQPTFRAALDRCDLLLRPLLERPLLSVIFAENEADAALINETAYTQPALFALEYALAELWMAWGVQPSYVMGHSVGEYVAACIAGVFSLEDSLRLIAERARLMQALPAGGAMAAVFTTEAEAARAIAPYARELSIAAINGPTSIVISGAEQALNAVLDAFNQQGVKSRRLTVSHAFHSPLIEPMMDAFARTAAGVQYAEPRVGLMSNVTGRLAAAGQVTNPRYWVDHVRQPVRFCDAIVQMQQAGCDVFIEIGPNPTLSGMGQHCLPEGSAAWLPSLRQGKDDWQTLLSSLAQFYTLGGEVDWHKFDADYARRKLVLPTYPFQRERYWLKPSTRRPQAARSRAGQGHPLLGRRINTAGIQEVLFESQVGAGYQAFLADHRIHGRLILPSPAYMEMMLAAAEAHFGPGEHALENFVIHKALVLPDDDLSELQTVLAPGADSAELRVYFAQDGEWVLSASGQVRPSPAALGAGEDLAAVRARCRDEITAAACYQWLAGLDLVLGERFQGVSKIWRGSGEALCRMEMPEKLRAGQPDAYRYLHPAFLDACFHPIGMSLPNSGAQISEAYLLLGLDELRFLERPGAAFWNHIKLRGDVSKPGTQETFIVDITLYADDGRRIAALNGIALKRARPDALFRAPAAKDSDLLYRIEWQAQPVPAPFDSAEHLTTPQVIEEQLAAQVDALSASFQMPLYDEMLPQLDRLGGIYAADALRQLGMSFEVGSSHSFEALVQKLGIIPRQRALFGRLLQMLEEDGVLGRSGSRWQVLKTPRNLEHDAQWEELEQAFPIFNTELSLTARCTRGLAGALSGKTDPLHLLFPDGSMAHLEKLYQDAPVARTYNTLVREAVAAALHNLPAGADLRVLEIGAGTGGTTAYILPVLNAYNVSYDFTDISPVFTSRAAEKFDAHDFMEFRTLDISRDPLEQGYAAQAFDLVIAANVLHATPDLRETLRNVKTLLAPCGMLVLYEAVGRQRFSDLTVGLTDGWWSFTDKDLRPDYALLTPQNWVRLLGEVGFAEIASIPGEGRSGILSQQTVFVARTAGREDAASDQQPWLLIHGKGPEGHALAGALKARGQLVVSARCENGFDFAPLLSGKKYRGVVHMQALDNHLREDQPPDAVGALQRETVGSALRLAQAMEDADQAGLWIVTRGAQPAAQEQPAASDQAVVEAGQATVLGLARTIAIELPELNCKRVDLSPLSDRMTADYQMADLVDELLRGDQREEEIAYRDVRRVRRLVRVKQQESAPLQFKDNASYLITGGLRGLGLLVAEWMVERGAKHLALIGRSAPSEKTLATLSRLEQSGAQVLALQADVACEDDMQRVLAEAQRSLPPLAGIIHSAGVLDDGMLLQQSWERFAPVMAPKVSGTWLLHRLTREMPLDFFVLFSSGVSLLGSAGQANHAAANAFMDAFAAYRRALGLPATSINWGAWAQVGAAAERHLDETRHIAMLSPQEGLQALEWAMAQNVVQVGVFPANWDAILDPYAPGEEPALYREIAVRARRKPDQSAPKPQVSSLSDQLAETAPNKRKAVLAAHVRQQAAHVLSIANPAGIDPHQPLQALGLDSLMAVELRNKLGHSVEKTLPATLLFEYPTITKLTDYLAGEVFHLDTEPKAEPEPEQPAQPETPPVEAGALDSLSEDELAEMLRSKLKGFNLDGG